MKVLYKNECPILINLKNQKDLRLNKPDFLRMFMDDGFYLIDAVPYPITVKNKRKHIKPQIQNVIKKVNCIASYNPCEIKIILVSKSVFDDIKIPLINNLKDNDKATVINQGLIPLPMQGHEPEYKRELCKLLKPYLIEI